MGIAVEGHVITGVPTNNVPNVLFLSLSLALIKMQNQQTTQHQSKSAGNEHSTPLVRMKGAAFMNMPHVC